MNKIRPIAIISAFIGAILVLSGLAMMVFGQDTNSSTATSVPTEVIVTGEATPTIEPTQANTIPLPPTVSGIIENEAGEPVEEAIVQIQARPEQIETDADGAFSFSGIEGTTPFAITAWAEGHYIGWTIVNPSAADWAGGDNLRITLRSLPTEDFSQYTWFEEEGVRGSASCGLCHREYTEWQLDRHSQTASNIHFLTMYNGTNVDGEVGQQTKWDSDANILPIDPNLPYYGPGFKLDNYGRTGNCATCHTPLASQAPNNQNCSWSGCHTSFTVERANGVIPPPASPMTMSAAEGISCEFCHKISEVHIDPQTNLPYPDMPGILSVRLHRPSDNSRQVFFGTLVDVTRNDSYLPLLSESQFCAGCHYGVFGGVVGMQRVTAGTTVYNSYGEWLASPYSNAENETTCQDCHMAVSDADWFVFPERLGFSRDYVDLHNHTMLGVSNENMMQNAVTLAATAERTGDEIQVEVNITNDKTGHNVPTDSPMRSLILVVEVRDANGNLLDISAGPVNPDFSGDYAGVPGKTFALILRDGWTGEAPTAAFWREPALVEDTRIAPMATDTSNYTFAANGANVTVHVRLLFRRAFYELAQQKGWTDPDILMEEATIDLPNE